MTTTVTADHRTPLLALRAAVRAVRQDPDPSTLNALSRALLALPTEPFHPNLEDRYQRVLAVVEAAEESHLFPVIDHMDDAVTDLTRTTPRWTPAHATTAMADAVRLLAACHKNQPDMEDRPLDPWYRAAESGTRLLSIMARRTDARPGNTLMVHAAREFAARLRTAVAANALLGASSLAGEAATRYGLFAIGARTRYSNGATTAWTRRFGSVTYGFELIEPGWNADYPHGCVDVYRGPSRDVIRRVPLTDRTHRKVLDRFIDSL